VVSFFFLLSRVLVIAKHSLGPLELLSACVVVVETALPLTDPSHSLYIIAKEAAQKQRFFVVVVALPLSALLV
jgi:hypothetical protein